MKAEKWPPCVLLTLSLYLGCASACTAHRQPVLRECVSLYCIRSACTAHAQLVLHILYTQVFMIPIIWLYIQFAHLTNENKKAFQMLKVITELVKSD